MLQYILTVSARKHYVRGGGGGGGFVIFCLQIKALIQISGH